MINVNYDQSKVTYVTHTLSVTVDEKLSDDVKSLLEQTKQAIQNISNNLDTKDSEDSEVESVVQVNNTEEMNDGSVTVSSNIPPYLERNDTYYRLLHKFEKHFVNMGSENIDKSIWKTTTEVLNLLGIKSKASSPLKKFLISCDVGKDNISTFSVSKQDIVKEWYDSGSYYPLIAFLGDHNSVKYFNVNHPKFKDTFGDVSFVDNNYNKKAEGSANKKVDEVKVK